MWSPGQNCCFLPLASRSHHGLSGGVLAVGLLEEVNLAEDDGGRIQFVDTVEVLACGGDRLWVKRLGHGLKLVLRPLQADVVGTHDRHAVLGDVLPPVPDAVGGGPEHGDPRIGGLLGDGSGGLAGESSRGKQEREAENRSPHGEPPSVSPAAHFSAQAMNSSAAGRSWAPAKTNHTPSGRRCAATARASAGSSHTSCRALPAAWIRR